MHACMYLDDEPINTKEDDMQEKLELHDGRHLFAVGKPTTHNMHACIHVQESQHRPGIAGYFPTNGPYFPLNFGSLH